MSIYIPLMKLTPEGREKVLGDPDYVLHAASAIRSPGIQTLGLYAVLGEHDFVSILDAPDNEAVARFSIEWGVKAGVLITTLPAIPISRLGRQILLAGIPLLILLQSKFRVLLKLFPYLISLLS